MPIDNLVKSVQNIMWKDEGVAGDGQRIEQIVWMLFLKLLDDQERFYELRDTKYKSPVPESLRWRNWAGNPEGITGDELLEFVNTKLFPGLKGLKVAAADRRALLVRSAFEDAYNYMKSGTLIRQVVNRINEVDFNKSSDRYLLNDIYEKLLKDLQGAGKYGEFYTPRPLTEFVVEMVNPKPGNIVLDPACGTGGFLVNTIEHIQKSIKNQADKKKLHDSIRGVEIKSLPHLLAITNLILHGVEIPDNVRRDDMLARPLTEYGPKDRVDVIVANPPFGASVKDGTEKNFPSEFRTKETADLFLVLFMHLLKPNGRAGVVLPDGTLFGEGVKTKIKEKLLAECNVHTIVRLPQGVFSPYAGVNTNLVFFEKGTPTKDIWYYEMPLPEGLRQYSKGTPIRSEEFEPVKKWWGGEKRVARKASPSAWKVSLEEIKKRDYNLDFKNPNGPAAAEHKTPKQLLGEIEKSQKAINNLLTDLKDFF
jgi:type I restriction enzyme M protein